MTVRFYTLGCKVNQYETEAMAGALKQAGFLPAADSEQPSVIVINSCTVTSESDSKARKLLHRCRRQNPDAVIVLTGCYPQAHPDIADALPEADIILGSKNRSSLTKHVQDFLQHRTRIVDIEPHTKDETFEDMRATDFSERTRATIKIQDGCNRFCSYCIIPTARGPVRSKELALIRQEVASQAAAGYRETVLTGINLSAYGEDCGKSLADALEAACSVKEMGRIRLGSLEPDCFTPAFIDRIAKLKNLCPHFHLSLQSGCEATLRAMNRHYTPEQYLEIATHLRRAFPHCAITTDVMVGFPGETPEHFEESLAFVKKVGFARVHVFAYSIRPSTKAALMEHQVPKAEKERRSHRMIRATDGSRHSFWKSQLGCVFPVLFEQQVSKGVWEGYSPNYTPIHVTSEEPLGGQIREVFLQDVEENWCIGALKRS